MSHDENIVGSTFSIRNMRFS